MAYPNTPSAVKINNVDETADLVTNNTSGTLRIGAKISDPDKNRVRMVVRYSTKSNFSSFKTAYSGWGKSGTRQAAYMRGLSKNTKYYVRVYAQQQPRRLLSKNYNAANFWTNRYTLAPVIVAPADNAQSLASSSFMFDWQVVDPDDDASPTQNGFQLQYRIAGTALLPPGPWVSRTVTTGAAKASSTTTFAANTFKASTTYEWRVRTRDPQNQWGAFSLPQSFRMQGATKPPKLLTPAADTVVLTEEDTTFSWLFQDPDPTAVQGDADIRYRALGAGTWIDVFNVGPDSEYTFAPDTFAPGYRYEWQVRTDRATGTDITSDYSPTGYFWTISTPGGLATNPLPLGETGQGELGCGNHRVFIFDRGGIINRGEITPITAIRWGRKRDDISDATITVTEYDQDCGELLGMLRSWAHEVVVYRDDDRVFEGPITTLTYRPGEVTIAAKDPIAYIYRRILRQGYNDSHRIVGGVQVGLKTVVERGALIIQNCLGYADPNVLPYLTLVTTGEDARQSRVVPDYTKTAWEEIDDLAANAGLDYTAVGRRIILWDTHSHLGILPELRDDSFSDPPIVSEYGMSMSNYFAVTDGQGAWGAAIPNGTTEINWYDYYGPIEQLASGYGDAAASPDTMTPTEYAAHIEALKQQARRNIDGRWPTPLVARVPDNSTIKSDVPVGINQLVPGTWIPLRIENTVRPFGQMQKLDSVTVEQDGAGERVQVVMSPAPQSGDDPDATGEELVEEG